MATETLPIEDREAPKPPCLTHPDLPAVWQSPTGHWFCQECVDLAAYLFRPQTGGTLAELLEKDLDPIRWTVEDVIPEGLTFLAGKPKLGKSWLALVLALAVASGSKFLGYRTEVGTVLYVALEDGERRIQERARWLGARSMVGLERFHYRCEWPTLDKGGMTELEEWMNLHPQTRLVIVDTFGKVRGDMPGRDKYQEEYALLGRLQSFALKHGIAVVLVHHLRKMGADDWLEQLSGSQAVTGAADTLLGIYRERGQMDATLRTVSRDAEELELALQFNGGRWECMGPAEAYRHSVERSAVLEALRNLGGEGKVSEIAKMAEKTGPNTSYLLGKLAEEKAVEVVKHGVYRLLEVLEVLEVKPDSDSLYRPLEVLDPLKSPSQLSSNQANQGTALRGVPKHQKTIDSEEPNQGVDGPNQGVDEESILDLLEDYDPDELFLEEEE